MSRLTLRLPSIFHQRLMGSTSSQSRRGAVICFAPSE